MSRRLFLPIVSALLILIVIGVVVNAIRLRVDDRYACTHGGYPKIENGMSAEQVGELLGKEDRFYMKKDPTEYRFGQGDMESQITSALLYDFPSWSGSIEIYLNADANVIGKNCGQG